MSLNGLDDPKVREAHEVAVAEPGGWFLLKYASRDEVELLGRGNGGIVEIRNNIAQYEEASPLYGFLRYRRRNVIIKYLPDDCSRLVQARVTVHFNAVCDRFAPYDTTFSIATAKELKDTKLSAACSLHAASGSTSSSTSSLRRRRLMEIAEEEEEEQRAKRQSVVKEEDSRPASAHTTSSPSHPAVTAPPVTLNSNLAASPEESQFAGTTDMPSFTGVVRPSSPAKSFDYDTARRMSSQTTRPDLYSYSSYTYGKPKVKLGPRPSLETSGRPRTAGATAYRPVASIPAGLKLSTKGSKRGRSQDKAHENSDFAIKEEGAEIAFLAASIPIPEQPSSAYELEPPRPHTSGGRPATSSGVSIKSATSTMAPPTKQNTMTREKARLMKAMQLREKKKAMALQPGPTPPALMVSPLPSPIISETPEHTQTIPEETDEAELPHLSVETAADLLDTRASISKADSGIDVASSIHHDHVSVDTMSDSHPTSPIGASSEIGDSTKASSLSESTDETVQAPETKAVPDDEVKDESEDSLVEKRDLEEEDTPMDDAPRVEAEGAEVVETTGAQLDEEEDHLVPQPRQTEFHDVASTPSTALPVSKFAAKAEGSPGIEDSTSTDALTERAGSDTVSPDEPEKTESEATSPPLKLPKSKFSTQDMKSLSSSPLPSIVAPVERTLDPTEESATEPNDTKDVETASLDARRTKRRAFIEPIKTDMDMPEKDNLSDDDELLDELQSATVQEAKPVTVTKTPITADFPSFSPPKKKSDGELPTPRIVRTVSSPIRGPLLAPGDVSTSSARAVSSGAAYLHKITQQQASNNLAPKTGKIGSSISQRIKALEKLSSTAVTADGQPRERPSSTFFSVRKSSVREPSRSPSVAERANSLTRGFTPSPPRSRDTRTREGSPEELGTSRDRSASITSRLSMFEGGNAPRGRPESIQVTARIVRDPNQPFPKMPEVRTDTVEFTPVELRQSPLIVDHQRAGATSSPAPVAILPVETPVITEPQEPRKSIQDRRLSKDKRRSQSEDRFEADKEAIGRPRRRSSLTIVKDFIKDRRDSLIGKSPSTDNLHLTSPALQTPGKSPSRPPSTHQNNTLSSRLSISSRRSSISRDNLVTPVTPGSILSPSAMTETSGSGDENKFGEKRSGSSGSIKEGKNRASRFIRRLSSSLSSSRGKLPPSISPTVAEEDVAEIEAIAGIPPSRGSSLPNAPSIIAYMGDVNVQFPDNLLWKRRTMCLDSQGFLILSAVQGVTATTTAATAAAGSKEKHAGPIKRYHLSDFRQPYTPEMELQELPNSVCLDFVDGSGLQIACEDRAGQLNILHILQDAHQSHTSFGQ